MVRPHFFSVTPAAACFRFRSRPGVVGRVSESGCRIVENGFFLMISYHHFQLLSILSYSILFYSILFCSISSIISDYFLRSCFKCFVLFVFEFRFVSSQEGPQNLTQFSCIVASIRPAPLSGLSSQTHIPNPCMDASPLPIEPIPFSFRIKFQISSFTHTHSRSFTRLFRSQYC